MTAATAPTPSAGRLAVLGASGHGKVVADAALAAGWRDVEFFDDAWPHRSVVHGQWPVAGDTRELWVRAGSFDGVVVAIGNASVRLMKQRELAQGGARLVSIVHPGAWISPSVRIGAGCVVMAGAVINADATLGQACIVNTAASVDHDCCLADAVHVSPGARLCGDVRVGECSWIGVGAAVRQGISIGAGVTVGAGAVVVKAVPDGLVVLGCPAVPVQRG